MILASETICILLGMLPLVLGYMRFNLLPVGMGCLVVGLLWLVLQRQSRAMVSSLCFIVLGFAAGMGAWIGVNPFLMAISLLGSLMAWDLTDFSRRLRRAAPEDNLRNLERRHILQLAMLGGIGLSLILTVLFGRLKISFGWILLLVIVFISGMIQLVNRLRQSD